ncbi:MAG: pepsin/retropepsin-like aspartic protease family protein [Candidatus Krumholzibacteriia bacterium]
MTRLPRFVLPLLALAAIAAVLPCPVRADDPAPAPSAAARALLEAHVAWLGGWAALDSLRDFTCTGTIAVAGLSGTLTTRQRRDGRARDEFDLTVIRGTECLTGDGGWELNASGQVETMGSEKAAQKRRALDRSFGRHLHGEGVVISAAGSEEKEGRAWSVLRFAYPNGDLHDLLVDPATGESVWQRDREDGRDTWTRLSDLRVADGLRRAWRRETFNEHAAENQTVTWTSVASNTGLADALFARPDAGARVARLPAGVAVTDWQPIELLLERYIVLRGAVNGTPCEILLDSGAGMTVLDKAFAETIGLRAEGAIAAQGTGGRTEAGLVGGVTLTLGRLEIGPLSAAVIDLSPVASRLGRPLPVILGKELFHALGVDLDYPNSRIRFHDPATLDNGAAGRRLALLPAEDGHKNVMMTIEGGEPVVVGLDTGQGGELTVFRHYADAHGLLDGRPLSERLAGGVGGATTTKVGTLRAVTLAGYELRDVPVSFHTTDVNGAFDTKLQAGNLGAGILRRFRVLFDYPHDCLWLEPGPELAAPFPKDKTGLGLQWIDGALTVVFVAPGSPAAAAGWRDGERVTALDGVAVAPDWWQTFARWSHAPAGTVVTLTLADGTVRSLTLRAYY